MNVTLYGAAGEVTGSAYHVQTARASVLVDFGLFQGRHLVSTANRVPPQLQPNELDATVLTHAHLDHTGRLPLLGQRGYHGPIYATPATLEVTRLILEDTAKLQEQDAARANRKLSEKGKPPLEPLFTAADVAGLLPHFKTLSYVTPFSVAPGVSVQLFEAGHILGSTSIEMVLEDSGVQRVVVFSGDLGPRERAILRDAACLTRADLVFLESTYGDRNHRSLTETVAEFRQLVSDAVAQRGTILVPTFAVGRAQQILFHLAGMFQEKVVPAFPVILDSPMAIEATRLYARHPELFDDEMRLLAGKKNFLEHLPSLRHSVTATDSRALNDLPGPCLIMAGAGCAMVGASCTISDTVWDVPDSSDNRRLPGARVAGPGARGWRKGDLDFWRKDSGSFGGAQPGRLQRARGPERSPRLVRVPGATPSACHPHARRRQRAPAAGRFH